MHKNMIYFMLGFNQYFKHFNDKYFIQLFNFDKQLYFCFYHMFYTDYIIVPMKFCSLNYENIQVRHFIFEQIAQRDIRMIFNLCKINTELETETLPLIDLLSYIFPNLQYRFLDQKIALLKSEV